jgi:predicted dehydrogenase
VLRVGVVGVSGMGQAHVWAARTAPGIELVAACDVDASAAEKTAQSFEIRAFTDAHEMYASGAIDAVVIATPPATHVPLARAALDAGIHVYCEKPIAPTCDEGYALATYARDKQRTLQIGFQFRYHKGYAALREAVAQLGAVRRAHVTATNWFRPQAYFDSGGWRATWRVAGGGVLMTQAIHQIDALIATVGMPSRVRGRVDTLMHRAEVEDVAVAEFEWDGSTTATFVASNNEPAGVERFEIVCEHGVATLSDGFDVRVARHDGDVKLVETIADAFPETAVVWETIDVPRARSEEFDMVIAAHTEFANAIAAGREPLVSGAAGTRAVELANAIYLSSCRGAAVDLPLATGEYPPVFEELASGRRLPRS